MNDQMIVIRTWSWIYLVLYIIALGFVGYIASKRVKGASDYAVARGQYPWWMMAFTYAATVASGSTAMGIPGMTYNMGFKALYYPMIYPLFLYVGTMLISRRAKRIGDRLGCVTMPEYYGKYYQSKFITGFAAVLGLFFIYYVMSQIVAIGQAFTVLLNIPYTTAIWVGGLIVLAYMVFGGTHSDVISNTFQGIIMFCIAAMVVFFFFTTAGVDGGLSELNAKLPELHQWNVHTDPKNATYYSWWTILLLGVCHIPFCSLHHTGVKFFTLKGTKSTKQYSVATAVIGLMFGCFSFAGLLGRAMGIVAPADRILPLVFIQLLPPWLAAFAGVAIIGAVLSTTSGLLIAMSQIFANDIYRNLIVPAQGKDPNSSEVNKTALLIGRVGMIASGILAIMLVRTPPAMLSILLWVGIGGVVSAFAGPFFGSCFYSKANKTGAICTMLISFAFYFAIHLGPQFKLYAGIFPWNKNPFASAGAGALVSFICIYIFSHFGPQLPKAHIQRLWEGTSASEESGE